MNSFKLYASVCSVNFIRTLANTVLRTGAKDDNNKVTSTCKMIEICLKLFDCQLIGGIKRLILGTAGKLNLMIVKSTFM